MIVSETDLSISTGTGTLTSSSTIPGLGATSGKVFKRLGSVVVNGVDAILIRRRLAQIERTLVRKSDASIDSDALRSLYADLLELSRWVSSTQQSSSNILIQYSSPAYTLSVRVRAFRLIMDKVGGLDFKELAAAFIRLPLSDCCDLLEAMISCLQKEEERFERTYVIRLFVDIAFNCQLFSEQNPRKVRKAYKEVISVFLPDAYLAAGMDAYNTRAVSSIPSHYGRYSALMLFIGLAISLSQTLTFSRMLISELDILDFIPQIYARHSVVLKLNDVWTEYPLPADLVLRLLSLSLDQMDDVRSIDQILELQQVERFTSSLDHRLAQLDTEIRHKPWLSSISNILGVSRYRVGVLDLDPVRLCLT